MKQILQNGMRLSWVCAKVALLLWLLTRNLEAPVFLYRNF